MLLLHTPFHSLKPKGGSVNKFCLKTYKKNIIYIIIHMYKNEYLSLTNDGQHILHTLLNYTYIGGSWRKKELIKT